MSGKKIDFGTKCCEFCGVEFQLVNRREVERRRFCSRPCRSKWMYREVLIPNKNFGSVLEGEREEARKKKQAESLRKHWKRNKHPMTGRKHSDETKRKVSESQKRRYAENPEGWVRGERHPHWGGGAKPRRDRWVYAPWHPRAYSTGYLREYVLIAEEMIGRYLRDDEVVHHKDGDNRNNDPANLQVMTAAEHTRMHAADRISAKTKRK